MVRGVAKTFLKSAKAHAKQKAKAKATPVAKAEAPSPAKSPRKKLKEEVVKEEQGIESSSACSQAVEKCGAKKVYPVPNAKELRKMTASLDYLKRIGKPEAYNTYHSQPSREAQRQWFHEVYKSDPSLSQYKIMSFSSTSFKGERNDHSKEWKTELQIMVDNGYLDEKAPNYEAAKKALLKGLPVRDHINKEMSNLGHKQYEVPRLKAVKSQGHQTAETLIEKQEVDEKTAIRLRKSFCQDQGTQEESQPQIMIEPWKKESQDCDRKIKGVITRGNTLMTQAQHQLVKLETLAARQGTAEKKPADATLAGTQKSNLEQKLSTYEAAAKHFSKVAASAPDAKSIASAKDRAEKLLPGMTLFKEHSVQFEKVVKMVTNYIELANGS